MSGLPDEIDVHYDEPVENKANSFGTNDLIVEVEEEGGSSSDNVATVVEPNMDDVVHPEKDEEDEEFEKLRKKGYKPIDHLDEDEPIPLDGTFNVKVIRNGKEVVVPLYPQKNPRYIVVSCMTPEGVKNSRMSATKLRSPAFDDFDVADAVAKWRKDSAPDGDYWSIGVQELYKFTPIDESDKYVETMKYGDAKQQKIMQQQKLDELNDLAGKKKEMMDKKRKGFDRRKKDRILASQSEKSGKSGKKKKKPQKTSRATNFNKLKNRMKSLVAKRNQESAKQEEKKKLEEKEKLQKENIKKRREQLSEKERHANTIKENMENIKKALRE